MKRIDTKQALSIITTFGVMASCSFNASPADAQASISNLSKATPVAECMIEGQKYSVTKIVVNAPAHEIWRILTDYDNAPRVFPMVKKCQVIKDEGTHKIVKHVVAPSGPVGTYAYTLRITEKAPRILEWKRVSGAFKDVKGFYKLESLDNGRTTQVTYASYVDGGFLIPQPFIRRQSRIDMPTVMSTLKAEAESKVEIAGRP